MPVVRIKIALPQEEYSALLDMAVFEDLRKPEEELRWLLRQELIKRGKWPPAEEKTQILKKQ
ncbi:MAG: hypothetical protein V3W19_05930 [Desulfatiglandales bacterium]